VTHGDIASLSQPCISGRNKAEGHEQRLPRWGRPRWGRLACCVESCGQGKAPE